MKYPDDYINKIICSDCLEVMKGFPDNCIDTIITDPPYGLSFMGKKWDYDVPSVEIWQECLRVLKPGGTALIFAGSRTQHRMAVNVEDAGFILKDCIMWLYGSGFPKATDISKQCGEIAKRKQVEITKATTPEATLWNGWKSHGLKPAYEPILVAMKPNEGSYANNALKWGVAGLNIDGGRIETEDNLNGGAYSGETGKRKATSYEIGQSAGQYKQPQGRYPANVILDEESARMLDEQAPKTGAFAKVKSGHSGKSKGIYHDYEQRGDDGTTFYNDGLQGASRFFYCAKASPAERNRGLIFLENVEGGTYQFRQDGSLDGKIPIKTNHHPTVKPLALMKYLCTLTKTPTGGIVLDPFCGSGTTLMACKELKRDYMGIEKDKEYCKIARKRIKAILELLPFRSVN